MAAALPDSNQLDRLGRELKCSICLSLFKQASSLSCNHTFCRSCILQSVKSRPTCPLCKVPTTRREIRQAPQMDSLVAIYVSMGNAAGMDFMASQAAPDASMNPDTTKPKPSNKKRKVLSNITNNEKRIKSKTHGEQKTPENSFKGHILAKKRVQVPKPSSMKGEFGLNKDESTLKDCSAEKCEFPDYHNSMRLQGINVKGKEESEDLDTVALDIQMPKCKKARKGRKSKKACGNKRLTKKNEHKKADEVYVYSESKRKMNGQEEYIEPPKINIKINQLGSSPTEEDTRRIKLDPFFWLRDENSQDSEEIHGTQPMASLSIAQPAFSDLKDSDDDMDFDEEIALVRPAFSDLKDSDDDVALDEEIIKDDATVNAGDGFADNFDYDCTEQTPEALKGNCSKEINSNKEAIAGISLENKEHHVCDVELSCNSGEFDYMASQDKVLSPCESKGKQPHVNSTMKDLTLRGCRSLNNINTLQKQEDIALGGLRDASKTQCSETFFDESLKIETTSNCKRKAKKCEASGKRRKCALIEKAISIEKKDALATNGKRKFNENSAQVSSQTEQAKLDNLEPEKSTIQSPILEMNKSKIDHPECIFCGSSKDSEVTGRMKHYSRNGVPVKKVNAEAKIIHVHTNCAEWAPDVYFVNDVAKNLTAESVRGQKMKCNFCGKKGAALGCCIKRCKKSYHYPCARALTCKWNEDKFIMLCPEHASEKFPGKNQKEISDVTEQKTNAMKKRNTIAEKIQSDNSSQTLKWQCGVASKWVLCGSALDSAGKEQLASFAKLTGASVTKTWNSNVTHVIAGTDEHGAARRTLKFLLAILEGKWILKLDWLKACTEANKPVNEEAYEVPSDIHGVLEGPKKARLRTSLKGPKLFEEFQFYFMGDFLPDYRGDLQALVTAGGGVVLHRKPVTPVDEALQKQTVVVYNNEASIGISKAEVTKVLSRRQVEAKELGMLVKNAHVVPHHWILDSIASSEVHAFPLK